MEARDNDEDLGDLLIDGVTLFKPFFCPHRRFVASQPFCSISPLAIAPLRLAVSISGPFITSYLLDPEPWFGFKPGYDLRNMLSFFFVAIKGCNVFTLTFSWFPLYFSVVYSDVT